MAVDSRRARAFLAALLLASAALFAIGTAIERSGHSEPASAVSGEGEAGQSESGEGGHVEGGRTEGTSSESHSEKETLLGVDIEGLQFVTIGVLVSIGLAILAFRSNKPVLFFVVVLFALIFAVLDGKELFHQLDESRSGLTALAGVIALLHLSAAVIAGREARALSA